MKRASLKEVFRTFRRRAVMASVCSATAMMLAVPAFASGSSGSGTDGALDPTLFDPLVSGVTSNISAVLPKVLIVVALLVGLGVVISLFKKHAKPS